MPNILMPCSAGTTPEPRLTVVKLGSMARGSGFRRTPQRLGIAGDGCWPKSNWPKSTIGQSRKNPDWPKSNWLKSSILLMSTFHSMTKTTLIADPPSRRSKVVAGDVSLKKPFFACLDRPTHWDCSSRADGMSLFEGRRCFT